MTQQAPHPTRRLFPGPGQAVLIVIAVAVVQVVAGFFLGVFSALLGSGVHKANLASNPWLIAALNAIAFAVCLFYCLGKTGESKRAFFRLRRFSLSLLPPVVLTAVSLAIVIDEMAKGVLDALGVTPDNLGQFIDTHILSDHPLGGLVFALIVAPVTEEFMFRGFMLRGLLTRCRAWLAITLTALLFGTLHANLIQFMLGVILGMTFGWWFFRTRSVGPGLLGHAVFNSVAYGSAIWPELMSPVGLTGDTAFLHQPTWLTASAVTLAGIGLVWFKRCADSLPVPVEQGSISPDVPPPTTAPLLPSETPPPLAVTGSTERSPPILVEPPLDPPVLPSEPEPPRL